MITYNSHLWIMFFLIDWLSFGKDRGGNRLKLDFQGQGVGRILDVDGQGGGGSEDLTIFMDVKCASSLNSF